MMYVTKKRGKRQPLCDLSQLSELPQGTPLYVITKSFSTKVRPSAYAFLRKASSEVNEVWNYSNAICKEGYKTKINQKQGEHFGKRLWVDEFTLNDLTGGVTARKINMLGEGFTHITQSTVASINRQLCQSRNQFKKYWLKFRKSVGTKKALGWVPFKDESLLIKQVKFVEKSISHSKYEKKHDTRLVYNGKAIGLFEMDAYLELVRLSNIFVPAEKELTEEDIKKNEKKLINLRKKALKEGWSQDTLQEREDKLRLNIAKDQESKDIPMVRLLSGSFSEDSLGDWYFNQTVEILCYDVDEVDNNISGQNHLKEKSSKPNSIGIDPNCKSLALSDGTFHDFSCLNKPFTTHQGKDITAYQKLALLQQNGHLKQVRRLHRKVARQRQDLMHKASTSLLEHTDNVFFGDLNVKTLMAKYGKTSKEKTKQEKKEKKLFDPKTAQSKQKIQNKKQKKQERKIKKLSFGKSLADQGISTFRQQLSYKSGHMGKNFSLVDEKGTTRTCSSCGQHTGPSGLRQLVIRDWTCRACGSTHHRDTNSGKNMIHAPVSRQYNIPQPGRRRRNRRARHRSGAKALLLGTIPTDVVSFAQGEVFPSSKQGVWHSHTNQSVEK